jgi:hypothetical protein
MGRKLPKWVVKSDEDAKIFERWCREVRERGEWGPSPGGAAQRLRCSRAMVDQLVARGVLVRNEFVEDDGTVSNIRISSRSIVKALENKDVTGRWTGKGDS